MARVELVMPKMGESIIEATILSWTVDIGGEVEQDEPVLEIATDKVDSEVPSPVDGILVERLFNEGDVVPVGEVIAILETESEGADDTPAAAPVESKPVAVAVETTASSNGNGVHSPAPVAEPAGALVGGPLKSREGSNFYSPLVLNIARTEGVSMQELEGIGGSGRNGRVTKKDILAYVKGPRTVVSAPSAAPAQTAPAKKASPAKTAPAASAPAGDYLLVKNRSFSHSGNVEIQEMDRMRRMIADNMVYSTHVSAHVTSFVEADLTNVVTWRKRNKNLFMEKYGEKLTYTPIFVQAIAQALREHPTINVSVDGDNMVMKKDINVGIAVALPNDNLIVPVIRNADRLNLVGLAAAVNDLANRARNNKLKLDELEGGTYTVSNVGTFGNVMGTPIIMQPQVAIMATGAIRKKPAVIETETGDFIGIRHMMFLSHSYDHRVVDGALGGRFVRRVGDILESWDLNTPV